MNITRANIAPFLDTPIAEADYVKVDAWLSAISAQLTASYGDTLPDALAPAVYNIVADAISRRLVRGSEGSGGGLIKKQNTGPSGVEYNTDLTKLTGWFWPGELDDLAGWFGNGALQSVRTPAPDGVRFGNLATRDLSRLTDLGIQVNENETEYWDGDHS